MKRHLEVEEEKPRKKQKVEESSSSESDSEDGSSDEEKMEFVLESKPDGDEEKNKEENGDEAEEKESEEKPKAKRMKKKRIKIDSLEYLKSLENLASTQQFEDEEDKAMFLENVFEEVKGNEAAFFFNGMAAYSIETILEMANDQQVRDLMHKLDGNWLNLCTNKKASHPIQIMLGHLAELLSKGYDDQDFPTEEGVLPTIQKQLITICSELTGNMERILRSTYGSFVLRDILCILSGAKKLNKKFGNKKKRTKVKRQWKILRNEEDVPEIFKSFLSDWTNEILLTDDFEAITFSQESVPVLAALIDSLHTVGSQEECDNLAKCILFWKTDEEGNITCSEDSKKFVHDLIQDKSASHLIEKVFQFCSLELAEKAFEIHFQVKIAEYALNKCANYCLQKILHRIEKKEHCELAYDQLFPILDQLILQNWGVIWSLVEACSKNTHNFTKFIEFFMNHFQIKKKENLFRKLIQDRNVKYSVMGSMIFASLLKFRSYEMTDIFVGALNYAENNIKDLTCDPTLSRVFDTAVKCFAKSRLRQKFIKMILNDFEQIIITEFGSYSVENAFWAANMKIKKCFMEELVGRYNRFSGNKFSKKVILSVNVDLYRRNFTDWQSHINSRQKKEKKKKRIQDLDKLD